MIEALLIGNVIFAVVLITARFEKQLHAKAAVFVWSALTTGYLYYLSWSTAITELRLTFFDLEMPFYLFPGIVLILLVLATVRGRWATLRLLVMLAFITMGVMLRGMVQTDTIIYRAGMDINRFFTMLVLTASFEICLLAPLTAFAGGGERIVLKLFRLDKAQFSKHLKILLGGLGIIVITVFISHLAAYGRILHITLEYPMSRLGLKAIVYLFYFVLINHFIGFALMRHLIFLLIGEERIWIAEVILYGAAYAMLSFFFAPLYIVREFVFGLVFAHWYMKTKTLTYGLIVGSVVWLFLL